MFERARRRRVWALAVAAVFAATAARAQAPTALGAQLAARQAALLRSYTNINERTQELAAELDSGRVQRHRQPAWDSVTVGSLRVRITGNMRRAGDHEFVARALERARPIVERVFGEQLRAAMDGVVLVWRRDSIVGLPVPGPSAVSIAISRPGAADVSTQLAWNHMSQVEEVERRTLQLYEGLATALAPKRLTDWAENRIPVAELTSDEWQAVAVELASGFSSYARNCYSGAAHDCETALMLSDPPGADVRTTAYRHADWPGLVAIWKPGDSLQLARRDQCTHGATAVCDSVIHFVNAPRPVGPATREALIAVALDMGGAGAMQRLQAASGTPGEIIAATAGAPIDKVIAAWLKRAHDAQAAATRPAFAELGAIAFWTIVCGVLATRRRG